MQTILVHSGFRFNPLTAKLFNHNFHPLEVVSRWRDPQLQVSENYSDVWKVVLNVLKKIKTRIYAAPAVKGLNLSGECEHSVRVLYVETLDYLPV